MSLSTRPQADKNLRLTQLSLAAHTYQVLNMSSVMSNRHKVGRLTHDKYPQIWAEICQQGLLSTLPFEAQTQLHNIVFASWDVVAQV